MSAGCVKRHEPLTWAALSHLTTNLWLTLGKATCVHRIDIQGLNLHCTYAQPVWLWWLIQQFIAQQVACVVSVYMRFRGRERRTIFRAPKTETLATQAVQQELFTIAVLSQEKPDKNTVLTVFTPSMSRPREAKSVATRISTSPSLNFLRASNL